MMDMVNEAKMFGIETSGGKLDWLFLKNARDKYITRLNGIYERNLGNSGVQIIQGVSARAFCSYFLFACASCDTICICFSVESKNDCESGVAEIDMLP